ncbi:phage tail protein [Lactiplantibacillus argentoratensis]|uniref:phage tail protein n=1 Tax=Lactiplantibacillus argentoratensis TaxID=271881 RepID=UPI003D7E57E2
MIKFHDPAGTPHFGQATITRTTSVNGGLSLTGEVFAGGDVLNGLDYGWWLNFDNEKYVITYKKLSDDTNTVVFDAIQQFFWDFAKVALHAQYTGSHEYTFYLGQLFDKSGYTYKNDVTVPAFEKENWGYKNKLDLFNDIIDQAGVEFEVHNETVHIAKQIGSDLTSFARKGINLSDLTEEMKISDFATYAKGYGAFKDAEDQSKGRLEVEYRSELAKQFGDLEMDPIVDERYTIADNLIAALKKQVDATYTVSMTMNIYDLENAGYPNYEAPKVGDWILAIDEALNFKRKIRIIQLEEQFDVTGKRIGYTATCGDLSIVDQYTHLQSSLDSRVQRIQKSVDDVAISADGKSSNYYGEKEPTSANEGDLWFDQSDSDPDKWSIKQWVNGRWEQITLNPGEVDAKVDVAKKEAETAVENAKSASNKADQLAAKYDDTNSLANQALNQAVGAQSDASSAFAKAESTASAFGPVKQSADSALSAALDARTDASSAVAKAKSTASEFGKVSQKTDTAAANALSAQETASAAVTQAKSAAADSKDAKQIAGAVSQSYKTLTDGSTMTIAELQNGLGTKLTKADLDGYATQTWSQNQIKMTADGINGTMSSIKSTIDSQTTSINDLKADSSSFKSQFTTVNNTLGKQTTDIGSLQTSSKELISGFNTLTTDNKTNKNDISQLKQTSTELSSTMETVQTQVRDSAIGTNLYRDTRDFDNPNSVWNNHGNWTKTGEIYNGMTAVSTTTDWNGLSQTLPVKKDEVYTYSIYAKYENGTGVSTFYLTDLFNTDIGVKHVNLSPDWQRVSITFKITADGHIMPRLERTVNNTNKLIVAGPKLERGSVMTDYSTNPLDNATVTALSKLSQTVDSMGLDISKKIEQKDLNGYATETWTSNQIKLTSDGINGTISSVKSTVDGHTTSINDLKADSTGFKSQFSTVNDTLGKQSTDIGTLQASSKELTTGFNTLTSDNTTNKNDISQLKQTATELSSTMTTVQTQVQDSSVGTNLYRATRDIDNPNGIWNRYEYWTKTGEIYNGMTAVSNNTDWNGLSQTLAVKKGETYTFSVYAKYESGTGNSSLYCPEIDNWNSSNTDTWGKVVSLSATWQRVFVTFNITADGFISPRIERTTNNTNKLIIAGPKLERGAVMTDYSVSPLDNATVSAISNISQTVDNIKTDISKKIEQKDLNGYATQTWAQNQINTTANGINGTISSVKSTVDGHTTSINDLKADSRGFKAQFTKVNNTINQHATDIGTLQADAKSLSSNFDSLSSDNNTNKNDISQLKQTATEFNSTLMTVQTRVDNSAVGTNLLLETYDPFVITGNNTVNQTQAMYSLSRRLEAGTILTLSFDAISTAPASFNIRNDGSNSGTYSNYIGSDTVGSTKKHYIVTVTLSDFADVGLRLRLDNVPATVTITFSNMKLELGSHATDYSTNPADNATVTAVSSISQTIDSIQTTVRGKVDNDTYQSKVVQLSNQITSVVGQVNTLGQRNLVANSRFQYDKFDGSTWTSDIASNWYSSDMTWSWWNGYQGICCNIPIANPVNTNQWNSIVSKKIYVPDPASVYSASAIFNVDTIGGRTQLVLDWYDKSMKRIGYATKGVTVFHTQTLVKIENQTPPTGTAYVAIHVDVNGGGHLAVIAPMLVNAASVGSYVPDNASWTEFQQTASDINLKVSKDGVVNAVNISPEGIQIYGNKLHITAATYIDNAVIKDAMIANLSANKLTAGSINAANINVYNINGANIVANSISADKLQAGAMLIAMNSTLQTLKIGTDGLYTTDSSGKSIGKIHTNRSVQHPENWGLDFDLNSDGKFMSWGAQNEGDPNGDYGIKFGWTRNSSASDFGMPWGGFWFNDNVMLHKNLRFDGGGIDVAGAYQLMKFAWIEMNGTKYPFFGSSNLKAGWLFGSQETYLVRGDGVINASKILGVLNGQSYKFIKSLNPDGSVKVYTDVHF